MQRTRSISLCYLTFIASHRRPRSQNSSFPHNCKKLSEHKSDAPKKPDAPLPLRDPQSPFLKHRIHNRRTHFSHRPRNKLIFARARCEAPLPLSTLNGVVASEVSACSTSPPRSMPPLPLSPTSTTPESYLSPNAPVCFFGPPYVIVMRRFPFSSRDLTRSPNWIA